MPQPTIAFIGAGNMAGALIAGLIADGTDPATLLASDPDAGRRERLSANYGIRTLADNAAAVRAADVVVLAVKPQLLREVLSALQPALAERRPLLISIAAGIRTASLSAWAGADLPLVRAMPNTPAMIQAGASGLFAAPGVSAAQRDDAERILRAVGMVSWLDDEDTMDAVTAVSGSGPAYYFLVMEAMEAAARDLGLEPDVAHLLTLQTALGAARMAIEAKAEPGELRRNVTSPGGTTERALQALEDGGLRALFREALTAARDRSIELSRVLGAQ